VANFSQNGTTVRNEETLEELQHATRPNSKPRKQENTNKKGVSLSLDVKVTLGCHFHKTSSVFMLTIEEEHETTYRETEMKF
jgi:hypothetical protein